MAFNLFDFSSVKSPSSSFYTGGDFGALRPESIREAVKTSTAPIYPSPIRKQAPSFPSIVPTASAMEAPTDEELQQLISEGYSDEEIIAALSETQVSEPKKEGGFLSSVESGVNYLGGGIGNIVGGFVEEVPRSVAGLATVASGLGSAVRSPFSPVEGYERGVEDAGFVRKAAEDVAGTVRKYGAYEPDSTGSKIGEVGAQIASTVAMPGGVLKTGAKGLELGARGAGQGVLETAKFTASSEGRLPTGTEAAIGGTLGAAIPLAGQALASTGKALTRKFPIATVMNDLKMTPTERKTIEKITGKNAAEYVLGKNLGASSKEELAAYFDQQAVNAFKSVNEKLGKVNVRVKSAPAKEAIKDIVEQMESSPKLKRAYSEDISYLKTLLKQPDYSPVELNNLRRAFDKVNTGMFTASGKMRSGLEADVDVRIREAISDEIEKAAKSAGFSVKEINNELRAGLTMKDAMLRSLSQEQKNNLVGLQDIGIMGVFSGGDPGTAIALGIAKRGLEGIRPGIAQKLYNLDKTPSATLPASRGNTVPARLKSGLIPRPDTVPSVPSKVAKPVPLKKAGNALKNIKNK